MTEDLTKLSAALKKFDFKAALRTAFGKCPIHGIPVAHGHWLKWCEKKGCTYHAPITRTQRLEADRIVKAAWDRANAVITPVGGWAGQDIDSDEVLEPCFGVPCEEETLS